MANPFSTGVLGPAFGNMGGILGSFNPTSPFAGGPPTVSMLERGLNLGTVVDEKAPGLIGSLSPNAQAGLYTAAAAMDPIANPGITVTSGYRSAKPGAFSSHPTREAVDVRNRGLSNAQQADVVRGLRAAGFTEVGVVNPGQSKSFGSHIHANTPGTFNTGYVSHGVPLSSQPEAIRNAITQEMAVPQAKPDLPGALPSYSQARAALSGPVPAGPIGAALNAQPATPVEQAKQAAARSQQDRVAAVEEAQQNVAREQAASALGIPGVTSPLDNFGPARSVQTQSVQAPAPAVGVGALGPVEGPFDIGTLDMPSLAPQGPVTIDQVQTQQAPPTVQQAPQVSAAPQQGTIAAPSVAAPAQGAIGSTVGRQGVSTVTGLAPSIERAIQGMGLGPAAAGFSYGYSPMGGVAAVHANAPEAVQAAATGPGLLGALGIGPKGQERVARTALGVIGSVIGGPALGALGVPAAGFLSGLATRGIGKRASAAVTGQASRGGSSSGRGGSGGSAGVGGTGRGGAADREGAGMSDRG